MIAPKCFGKWGFPDGYGEANPGRCLDCDYGPQCCFEVLMAGFQTLRGR